MIYKDFRFWCQKVLPLVYDCSLSYVEVLYKVVDYLNNLIHDTSVLSEEVAELREIVENLDVDIQTAVNEQLQQMLSDGDFDDIIDARVDDALDEAKDEIDDKLDEAVDAVEDMLQPLEDKVKAIPIVIGRVGRLLDNGVYGGIVSSGQGCAYDGTYYYTCGQTNSSDTTQSIAKFNQIGEISGYQTYTQLGHANGMCYLNGKFYVANGSSATISVVNASTLAYESAIDVSAYGAAAIAVCTDGTNLYSIIGSAGNWKMHKVENGTATVLFSVPYKSNLDPYSIPQGCTWFKGKFYVIVNRPNTIYEITEDGELTSAYYVPSDDGYFPLGELEGFLVKGEELLLFSTSGHSEAIFGSYSQYLTTYSYQLFACSIGNGNVTGAYQIAKPAPLSLTVNGNGTHSFNPISSFTTVEEACWIANLHHAAEFNVSNVTSGLMLLENGKYSVYAPSGNRTISTVVAVNCTLMISQLSISSLMKVEHSNVIVKSGGYNCVINIAFSNVKFIDAWFANLQSLTWTRSEIEIDEQNDGINSSATITMDQSRAGYFRYIGRCREYVIRLARANGSAAFVQISIPSTKPNPVSVCMTSFAAGSYATGDSNFPYVKIDSADKLYLVNDSSQDILLSGQTAFMKIEAL